MYCTGSYAGLYALLHALLHTILYAVIGRLILPVLFDIIQMEPEEDLEKIIDVLNSAQYRPRKHKPAVRENIPEEIACLAEPELEAEEFQELIEARLEREHRKKEGRRQPRKEQSTQKPKPQEEPATGPAIRYLRFKNWSGQPVAANPDLGYKFKFVGGAVGLVKNLLEENGFIESGDNDVTLIWNNGVPKPETLQGLAAYQKINHFPRSFEVTRKDLMQRNISKMQARHGLSHFNFIPQTYILPADTSAFTEEAERRRSKKQYYIVKPHNQSQGRGIWITDRVDEILKRQKDCIVVSHYIENPLLINGLKFDMRIYVGITCFHPLRIYMYEEGLARFATYEYKAEPKENAYAHLTNYSLNKFSDQFVANEDENNDYVGHKWSLTALKEYLRTHGYDLDLIWGRVEDLVVKSIISVEGQVYSAMEMSVPFRDNCFEVLGFDILLDAEFRPWLLEINLSPSMNTDSPMDLKIKGSMVADMFTMVGVVPLDQRYSADKTYLVNGTKAVHDRDFKRDFARHQEHVIRETEEEAQRAGGWKRIYPTAAAVRYKQFFEEDRPFNRVLRDYELSKLKQGPNAHLAVKQLRENPQAPRKRP